MCDLSDLPENWLREWCACVARGGVCMLEKGLVAIERSTNNKGRIQAHDTMRRLGSIECIKKERKNILHISYIQTLSVQVIKYMWLHLQRSLV